MATYPGGIRTWTTKRDFSQTIIESHMNDIQTELVAGETIFGVNPQIATNNPGGLLRDYTTVTNRITSMVRGEHLPYFQAALFDYSLHTADQDDAPDLPDQTPSGHDLDWCGHKHRQRCRRLRLRSGDCVRLPFHWERPDRDGNSPWCGLPVEEDPGTVADGGWQRLPMIGQDDPFSMGLIDGLKLNQTGFWMINLRVDHTSDDDTIAVQSRRYARLEINGKAMTLQHMIRENEDNHDYLTNYVSWIEVLPKNTIITASARADGEGLTQSLSCNAFLRAHLIRCTDEDDDGLLVDFPDTIYKPPPPPDPPCPSPPHTPSRPSGGGGSSHFEPDSPDYSYPTQSSGTPMGYYAAELRPGEWYGYYPSGYTVGPSDSPIFADGLHEAPSTW
jgi:hypothetical protein